jgi:hypothetical protein
MVMVMVMLMLMLMVMVMVTPARPVSAKIVFSGREQ